jgi:ferredoxin-NADP reductase
VGTTPAPATLVKLKSREAVAEGTLCFHFEKPAGWIFKAGQAMDVTLLNPAETDAEGNTRAFSITSSPQDNSLMIATRMRDTAFKRTLKTMPLGTEIKIDGPFGDLTLHNNPSRAAVFLAGGIGITPFHSIALRAAVEKLPHAIFLFFSNRHPEDAAFLEQLQKLENQNPNYKLIATMTDMQKSQRQWTGETGKIDQSLLSKYLKNASSPIYYIAGPPGMVKGLHEVLNKSGVDDDDIRTEEFGGY